ncbi:hypothetical protein MB46_10250 [Arthrobacter alpinus]|nr:hypothetical protein MB46_10250 [Arthrobacter alpinus]
MLDYSQEGCLFGREGLKSVEDYIRGDPKVFSKFMDTSCPRCVLTEILNEDEPSCSLGAHLGFDSGLLTARVSPLEVDQLVCQCAAARDLLKTIIKPNDSKPISASRGAVGHANE